MLLNLTDVLTSEGLVISKTIPVEMTKFCCKLGEFSIVENTPVEITVSNLGVGKAMVVGKTEVVLKLECSRCLKEVLNKMELSFTREVAAPEYQEEDEDGESKELMEGYQLNIETLINNEILINLPGKVLCTPECKGICSVCGKDQNEGECGCDTFVPDPRMAAIKDIFNDKREV